MCLTYVLSDISAIISFSPVTLLNVSKTTSSPKRNTDSIVIVKIAFEFLQIFIAGPQFGMMQFEHVITCFLVSPPESAGGRLWKSHSVSDCFY